MKFALSICHAAHRPERVASLSRLLEALGESDSVVHRHIEDAPAPWHVWSERQWRAAVQEEATHGLFLNDDVVPVPDFWRHLQDAVSAHPNEVISLYASPKNAYKAPGAWVKTHDGLIGNGYVIPQAVLKDFLSWRENALMPGAVEVLTDDQLVNLYVMWSGRDVYHTVPSLIRHDESVPTCYGNQPVSAHHGEIRDWNTRAPHTGRFFKGNHWYLITHLKPGARAVERAYQINAAPW